MQRWQGKVALVTGTSSGIGAGIAEELVKQGLKVVGLARRVEKTEELKNKLKGEKGELFPYKADISRIEDIEAAIQWVEEKFGTIHILVNNAGIGRMGKIQELKLEEMKEVVDVNFLAVVALTQKALLLMKKSGFDDGHIININREENKCKYVEDDIRPVKSPHHRDAPNSIAGHYVPFTPVPVFNVYASTKFGVTALTEALRQEMTYINSRIRVTSISPGSVEKEVVACEDGKEKMHPHPPELLEFLGKLPKLKPKDIADCVVFALSMPSNVLINELTVRPVGEPC